MQTPGQRLSQALTRLLHLKGIIGPDQLRATVEAIDAAGSNLEGPRLVARAWTDPAFKDRLLKDAGSAAQELGIIATNSTTHTVLRVVESTAECHHLVVCTLCSCYPLSILGLSPPWYKDRSFRARAVREPRAMLKDSFGLDLDPAVRIKVHDSTADLRHLVLPMRPEGTSTWSEEELMALVTRDTMIGVAVPRLVGK